MSAVVASLRPRFVACYGAGLRQDPKMSGRVVCLVHVQPDGNVDSVGLTSREGTLSDEVVACISSAIREATFPPKQPWLAVPVSLVQ